MQTYLKDVQRPRSSERRAPQRTVVPLTRSKRNKKIVIMIDPGHGGVDPGAISRSGAWEKHIVLAFSKELRRQLVATGKFDVRLTRHRDVFIRLRQRIAKARAVGANLFSRSMRTPYTIVACGAHQFTLCPNARLTKRQLP